MVRIISSYLTDRDSNPDKLLFSPYTGFFFTWVICFPISIRALSWVPTPLIGVPNRLISHLSELFSHIYAGSLLVLNPFSWGTKRKQILILTRMEWTTYPAWLPWLMTFITTQEPSFRTHINAHDSVAKHIPFDEDDQRSKSLIVALLVRDLYSICVCEGQVFVREKVNVKLAS